MSEKVFHFQPNTYIGYEKTCCRANLTNLKIISFLILSATILIATFSIAIIKTNKYVGKLEDNDTVKSEEIWSEQKACKESLPAMKCDADYKYRSYDGRCNNLQNTIWGAASSAYSRVVTPRYDDNIQIPIGFNESKYYNGCPLPSPRKISLALVSSSKIDLSTTYTDITNVWGQFLVHDILLTPTAKNLLSVQGMKCSETCTFQEPCFPINGESNDPRLTSDQICIDFRRSSPVCHEKTLKFFTYREHREQINSITHFLDGSVVYGSDQINALNFRNISENKGKLKVQTIHSFKKPYMPWSTHDNVTCPTSKEKINMTCFAAGDRRTNENLALLVMHTIWVRDHNRIAEKLLEINPHWNDETVYQETRHIVSAKLQHITYNHWLPYIIGNDQMNIIGNYTGYDHEINPSIIASVSTAVLRYGHALIRDKLFRLNENFSEIAKGNLEIHQALFAPWRLIEEGGVDPILRGLIFAAGKQPNPSSVMSKELTEKLFKNIKHPAGDLAAINIQRGRDHALGSYNTYRRHCNLLFAKSFEDLKDEIKNSTLRNILKSVYEHPSNIDLWVGGLMEDALAGAVVGPTFACLLIEQFNNLRSGDRFWFENPSEFSSAQLAEIKKSSLARVICDTSDDMLNVQPDVFKLVNSVTDYHCKDIPDMDFNPWIECCEECLECVDGYYLSMGSCVSKSIEYKDDKILCSKNPPGSCRKCKSLS